MYVCSGRDLVLGRICSQCHISVWNKIWETKSKQAIKQTQIYHSSICMRDSLYNMKVKILSTVINWRWWLTKRLLFIVNTTFIFEESISRLEIQNYKDKEATFIFYFLDIERELNFFYSQTFLESQIYHLFPFQLIFPSCLNRSSHYLPHKLLCGTYEPLN